MKYKRLRGGGEPACAEPPPLSSRLTNLNNFRAVHDFRKKNYVLKTGGCAQVLHACIVVKVN